MKPVLRAARGGLSRRKTQAFVIGAVLLVSTASATLALGMLVDSNSPFDHAFAAQHGAEVTATVAAADAASLAATAHLPGVTATAGPFPGKTVTLLVPGPPGVGTVKDQLNLAGRSSPSGPVDDLTLTSGHWVSGPGQIVLAGGQGASPAIGTVVTVQGTDQHLTVVGIATSVTGTAQGWVTPTSISLLPNTGPAVYQMLYRFASAGSTAAVSADTAEVSGALPHGVLLGTESYLAAKLAATSSVAPWVPFIVAFGVIGLVMSSLIVVNVVSGAVIAGTLRIGVLKSIGFTPIQVCGVYVLQVAIPALTGCLLGVVVGNGLAVPLLGDQAQVYQVGKLAIPIWVDVAIPVLLSGLAVCAATGLAARAGRMSAVHAIATGRAPRPRHGYLAHRMLGRVGRLPRPATIGLASPFARPGVSR
jgi:putative ABC transport system permease protein